MWCDLHNFRASPDEVRGRLSKLTRRFLTNSLSTRWVYLLTFWVGNGQKKLFRSWNVFCGCLVVVSMLLLSLVEKHFFSLRKVFSHTFRHIAVARMAIGWSWECPQGTPPKGVAGDLKHSQVWLHQHSQIHGTLVQCALALSQMLWPKKYAEKKNFSQAEKFFPSGPDRSIATATNQPEKTFQPLKSIFFERAPPWCAR